MRNNGFDKCINRCAGFHQQKYLAGAFKLGNQFFDAMTANDVLTLGTAIHKGINLAGGAVEYSHLEIMALHIQDQVFTHNGEADQADITLFICSIHCSSSYCCSVWRDASLLWHFTLIPVG